MTKGAITAGTVALVAAVVAFSTLRRSADRLADAPVAATAVSSLVGVGHAGLIHGRVTMEDGTAHEGRLRWGGDEEALWAHYFNGRKSRNEWADHVASDLLPTERISFGAFGIELFGWNVPLSLERPFMVRFGDIERIEPRGRRIHVKLKSGTVFALDRFEADDLADGIRVWNDDGEVVDLGEWDIRGIELFPAPPSDAGPSALHGTVRTSSGDFTGLLQWDREESLATDEIVRRTEEGEIALQFGAIRSITRGSDLGAVVSLVDGREILVPDTPESGRGRRGLYVDDVRYGRVLISWDAVERIDIDSGRTGPSYDDFAPGGPLLGTVVTLDGRALAGRLVFDLDESETTETLDAPSRGVHYTIPLGLVASIVLPGGGDADGPPAEVTLHGGETLTLERRDDFGEFHAGMLIFPDDGDRPEYVPWLDVQRIDFGGPPAT